MLKSLHILLRHAQSIVKTRYYARDREVSSAFFFWIEKGIIREKRKKV